ncbi:MAG: flavin reductase family protein [Clostridia bacterium]|nr:flavin reductase family protein [Clostridia bacterium]
MTFTADILKLFDEKWALVTAGAPDSFNTMTVSWGGMGTLWSRPVVTVYIKPVRYTHEFLDRNEYFTVSFFDGRYKKALALLGSKSGRDTNKVALSGLTPKEITPEAVGFEEAEATIVCRRILRQDLDLEAIPDFAKKTYYETEAPHTMYIGEIEKIL